LDVFSFNFQGAVIENAVSSQPQFATEIKIWRNVLRKSNSVTNVSADNSQVVGEKLANVQIAEVATNITASNNVSVESIMFNSVLID
jgi:hypothetical protein